MTDEILQQIRTSYRNKDSDKHRQIHRAIREAKEKWRYVKKTQNLKESMAITTCTNKLRTHDTRKQGTTIYSR